MTRKFETFVDCPACGNRHSSESAFQRWFRAQRELDSANGTVVADFDFVIQRYSTPGFGRSFQCVMFLEVKTNKAMIKSSQSKTLSLAKQLLRNQKAGGPRIEWLQDGPKGSWVRVKHFGGFLLRMSGTSPENSEWMEWNFKRINTDQLIRLLRFDTDPITLKAMDWRSNHHHHEKTLLLPIFDPNVTTFHEGVSYHPITQPARIAVELKPDHVASVSRDSST